MATRTHTQSLYYNMFVLVLLLIAQTRCDWVEISQNHYRQEPSRQVTNHMGFEDTTEAIIAYRNTSLLDKHWKKGVIDRVPTVANIRTVHVPNVRTASMQIEKNIFNRPASIHNNEPDRRYDSNILSKYHEEEIPIDPNERIEIPYHYTGGSSFERNSEEINFHKASFANTHKLSRIESVNKGYVTNVKKGHLNQNIGSVKSTYLKGSEHKGMTTTERTPQIKYQDESKVDFNYEGQAGVVKEQSFPEDSKLKGFSDVVKPIVQSLPINNAMIDKTESFITRTEVDSEDETSEAHSTYIKNRNQSDKNKERFEYESNGAKTMNSDGISKNTKGKTMTTMWKLIKVVTDSIYKSTSKRFMSKINYLEGLKSNILSSIEDQVERTWPDDNAHSSRRARDAAGRGHVEFPSSESALMSISFLTFAVFLIKLVLQVIHTYKNKTMMVTPAVVTAVGRAAAAMKSNHQ